MFVEQDGAVNLALSTVGWRRDAFLLVGEDNGDATVLFDKGATGDARNMTARRVFDTLFPRSGVRRIARRRGSDDVGWKCFRQCTSR